jgi:hypothetical protein
MPDSSGVVVIHSRWGPNRVGPQNLLSFNGMARSFRGRQPVHLGVVGQHAQLGVQTMKDVLSLPARDLDATNKLFRVTADFQQESRQLLERSQSQVPGTG